MKNKLKVAMIGCGHIAPRWLEAISNNSDLDLVAISDPDPSSFGKLTKFSFNNIFKCSEIKEAYNKYDIDAVFILTPPQYHARYIQDAIERGKHVLSEKPLCVNNNQFNHLKNCQKIAEEKGLITAVNQQYRWNPRIQAIRKAVQNRDLGEIFLVNSEFSQNNYHFKKWWRQQHEYISAFNWYIHVIDSMRYYLDQKPIKVRADFIRPPHSKILGYSSLLLDVEFSGGTKWHLTANQESIAGPITGGHSHFTMYGTKSTLVNTTNNPPYIFYPDKKKIELGENIAQIDNSTTYPPGWKDTIEKFVHSIQNKVEHPTSIKDNMYTIAILLSAIKSFEQKREILISDFIQ